MFAGPNGSGKSTIKSVVPSKLLGVYLNPDEIQKEIEDRGFLDVRHYGVESTREEILSLFLRPKWAFYRSPGQRPGACGFTRTFWSPERAT